MTDNEKAQAWASHLATKRNHRQARRSSFDAGWDAALAVFEQTRTPTDDEREAMRRIIAQGSYSLHVGDLPYADVADRLAASGFGFRRSEPEPSVEPKHEFDEDVDDCSMCVCGVPADQHWRVEPQSEPSDTLTIPRPHVPFGPHGVPEHEADAVYLDHAASNLEGKFEVGGSNVRATVVKLLRDVAAALRAASEVGGEGR